MRNHWNRILMLSGPKFRPGPEHVAAVASFLLPGRTLVELFAAGPTGKLRLLGGSIARYANEFAQGLGPMIAGDMCEPRRLLDPDHKPDVILLFPGWEDHAELIKACIDAGVDVCHSEHPDGPPPRKMLRDTRPPLIRMIDEACGYKPGGTR